MRKLTILIGTVLVIACFAGPALADSTSYHLNVIGFSNCDMNSMEYETTSDCFKGNAPYSNGHRMFVPLVTGHTRDICTTDLGNVGDEIPQGELAKGVRILVSDDEDMGPVDFDATDGLGSFTLPCGEYVVKARAVGKPGKDAPYCMEWNTLICEDEVTSEQVACDDTLGGEKYVLVGQFTVKRQKGVKPHWNNVTDQIIPDDLGVNHANYFPFLWLIYNDHLRILQLRFDRVGECDANGS